MTQRFRCFRAGGADYSGLLLLIKAAEFESLRINRRVRCPVFGVLADDQVGAGALVPLGELVAEGGEVSFTEIEPDDGI